MSGWLSPPTSPRMPAIQLGRSPIFAYSWEPSWLPLLQDGAGAVLSVDISGGRDTVNGVVVVDWEDTTLRDIRARSLAEVVEVWPGALEYWKWSPSERKWLVDAEKVPKAM